mgnify:CR=1 FL=1
MRYISSVIWIFFLLQTTILTAQINIQTIHVENGIIKGYYELDSNGLCYVRKGHTITIKGKTYPFYMRIEDNSTIRKWTNPFDTLEYRKFINMDFALDAQRGIYKRDLYLSDLEYGYDGTLVHSAGAFYYPKNRRSQLISCYYFSGDVIFYKIHQHISEKEKTTLSFTLKKMLEEKEFVVLKEAESVSHLSKKEIFSMKLKPTAIYSIFYCLDE